MCIMIDTNAPFPSPEDIELDAYFRAQDEMIQEMTDRGEFRIVCEYKSLTGLYGDIEFIIEEPKESLLKRLFSFLFR